MFFVASKILSFALYPLNWIVALLVISFFIKDRAKVKRLRLISLILFLFFSNRYIFSEVMYLWEGHNKSLAHEYYDAVIILGGYSSWNESQKSIEYNQSSERIIEGLRLYQTGVAQNILLTGGSGSVLKPEERESVWAVKQLIQLKAHPADIIVEQESRNTYENAIYSTDLLESRFGDDGKFILLTSAYHMPRAAACFRKAGLEFEMFKVDFKVDRSDYTVEDFIFPSGTKLDEWQILFREWVGYVVYRLRGFL